MTWNLLLSLKPLFIATLFAWGVAEFLCFVYATKILLRTCSLLRLLSLGCLFLSVLSIYVGDYSGNYSRNYSEAPYAGLPIFILLAFLLSVECQVIFILERFKQRSLGFLIAPPVAFLGILGIIFFDKFANKFAFSQPAELSLKFSGLGEHSGELLILLASCNWLYGFLTAFVYSQVFSELRKKKSVFLASRLPNLGMLRLNLIFFLTMGSGLFMFIFLANFYFIPEGLLPPSLASDRTLLPSLVGWLGLTGVLLLCLLRRIPLEKAFLYIAAGLIFVFWNLLI